MWHDKFVKPIQLRNLGAEKDRKVTWTELFYDLVFVVVIAELSHNLFKHTSIIGILQFCLLFIAVWWLYYDNRKVMPMRKTFSLIALWEYAHLPWMIGISILGICIHHAFNRYDQHLSIELSMLFIVFAVVMGSLALLNIACYLGGVSHNKACLQMIFFRLLCVLISLLFLIGINFLTPYGVRRSVLW